MSSLLNLVSLAVVAVMMATSVEAYKFLDTGDLLPGRFQAMRNIQPDFEESLLANYQPDSAESGYYLNDAVKRLIDLESDNYDNYRLQEADEEEPDYRTGSNDLLSTGYIANFFPRGADLEQRDKELTAHSSLIAGHQFVSGGAGEGKQHLQPNGAVINKEEVKTDGDLPAYCNPPNPCPLNHKGLDDCDPSPYSQYSAEYSKSYQASQNCMCDEDHNECSAERKGIKAKTAERVKQFIKSMDKMSPVVAKKSPRI